MGSAPIVDGSFTILFPNASTSPVFPPIMPLVPQPHPIAVNTVSIKGMPVIDAASITTTQPIAFCCSPILIPIYTAQSTAQAGAPVPATPCPFVTKPGPYVSDPTLTVKGIPILDMSAVFTCPVGQVPCANFLGVSTFMNG